jgi:prepilin-type processing-associated H-X9-DG protein
MKRLMLLLALCLSAQVPAVAQQPQGLLDLVPTNSIGVVHINIDPESPHMALLKEGADAQAFSAEEFLGALSQLAPLMGLSIDLRTELLSNLGPRIVVAFRQPEQGSSSPSILGIVQTKDPKQAADALRKILLSVARNDSEEAVPYGKSLMHLYKTRGGKLHLAYASMPELILVSNSQSMIADVLEGRTLSKESPLIKSLLSMPEGMVTFCVSAPADPNKPEAGALSILGGSMSILQDGFQMDAALLFEGEKPQGIHAALNALPDVQGDALKAIPSGALAVVAVGSLGGILDAARELKNLPKIGAQISSAAETFGPIAGLLRNDAAFALRGLLPKPSWVLVMAGKDETTLQQQASQLADLIGSMPGTKVEEVRSETGTIRILLPTDGKEQPKAVMAMSGRYALIAADRQSAEESLLAASSQTASLESAQAFSAVRSRLLEKPKLLAYVNLKPIAGAGSMLSSAFTLGNPAAASRIRQALSSIQGAGFSVGADEKAVKMRMFIGIPPGTLKSFGGMGTAAVLGAGVALPVLTKARERAHEATCMSNMRQLALAMMQYAQDWDEKLPPANRWRDAIKAYVKNDGVFRCPSDPDKTHPCSYAMNRRLSGQPLSRFKNPESIVLLFESTDTTENPNSFGEGLVLRHNGKVCFAFLDGHVELKEPPIDLGPVPKPAEPPKTKPPAAIQKPKPKPSAPPKPARPPAKPGTKR